MIVNSSHLDHADIRRCVTLHQTLGYAKPTDDQESSVGEWSSSNCVE
ncbi:hypothetical protein [Marinomonas sp. THO17]